MEKEFEELKVLFLQKETSMNLSVAWADKKNKSDLSELKKNHTKNIALFLTTACLLVFIDRVNAEKMETSLLGLILLVSCSLYYAASKSFLLYRLKSIRSTDNTLDVLGRLERYERLNSFMHTYGEILYVAVLSMGVYLYLQPVFETILKEQIRNYPLVFWGVWGAFLIWVVIHTLVVKRIRLKKELQILANYRQSLQSENE
ncbi:hypothetical protein [uncultured Fluviicola sp.]|uniref:hypothetical protein n=1 Tax=uncultured Fluviicola sp. TaxID=463303 RepID=UPI0025E5DFED|nr:hypothetical protein [uncultured Fluviicola sp.]